MKKISLLLALTFISINLPVQAMEESAAAKRAAEREPQTPVAKRGRPTPPSPFVSPHQVTFPTQNHCRNIINHLRNDKVQEALVEINNWYRKIPVSFMFTHWRSGAEEKARFYKNINLALFYSICFCILDSEVGSKEEKSLIIQNLDNRTEVLLDLGKYIIKFSILDLGKYIIKFSINDAKEKEISIETRNDIPNKIGSYTNQNFIKQALLILFDTKQEEIQEIGNAFARIINKIPRNIHERKELFYHTIIYGVTLFMGSTFSLAEAYTGEGRADLVLRSETGNCIIEFKLNPRNPEISMEQIERRHYINCFTTGKVKLLGINIYSRAGKPIEIGIVQNIIFIQEPEIQHIGDRLSIQL